MKEYTKPTFEYVELRPEERMACYCTRIVDKKVAGLTWTDRRGVKHTCRRDSHS